MTCRVALVSKAVFGFVPESPFNFLLCVENNSQLITERPGRKHEIEGIVPQRGEPLDLVQLWSVE